MYRQGDLLIVEAKDELLKGISPYLFSQKTPPTKEGKYVLLEGETSGHYHGVEVEKTEYKTFNFPPRNIFQGNVVGTLEVKEPAELTHVGHHSPIQMAPGLYFVLRQREYEPGNFSRPVMD